MFDVIDRRPPREPYLPPPVRDNRGFWQDGEKEAVAPDEEFKGDDMSSLAHGELELHRERREYMRLAAWEMPLLSKLAKPFNPPQKTHPLRFRYTTYMGEQHPAEPKVVVEFCPSDLPSLSPQQTRKFIKLCGPRYNPGTEIVKMSCESFTTAAENKRYLSDMVDALIAEAQDPKDTFEDVPFDFRHHKEKKKPEFPKEWLLTETRKKILEAKRAGQELEDQRKVDDGKLIDGGVLVEEALKRLPVNAPVMEEVISRGRGKAGRKR
ncbi:hypothetical protein M501DRAFT_931917 [Patellaria atrata CBS 101060]|uniref:Small ribosomal subunit protein mS35 mitochondrial conserved domain-containing protein n=1 Tax=Patellaria atrata CBS 101060 TaxID=1346257 RepID=A0A9P4SE79_9PEZI|nr:hypothetical protein M501DRAFT_931917 [Patellaria atrata CBS 101060]